MNVALDAPSRPALRYYGGKWRLAPWIISFLQSGFLLIALVFSQDPFMFFFQTYFMET